ncbi:transcription factor IBH1 [Lolium perenne]|uniref:transcription factor IBH1 n=1 Tax=Lolium perenne TaxID=4522 RepID=UPI0021EA40C5|nr:transcription factor IBH1 [Lolium perenne]
MDAKGAPLPTQPSPNPSRLASGSASAADAPKPMLAFHFLRALSRVHAGPARRRTRTISRAAYSSMARAAGPRRAWSRALLRQAQARRSATLASRRTAVLVRRRVAAGPAPPLALPRLTGRSSGSSGETSAARAALLPPPSPAPRQAGEPARSDALRRLVPGGAGMEYCSLLEETADYVRCLRAQVQLMQGLADLFSCQ